MPLVDMAARSGTPARPSRSRLGLASVLRVGHVVAPARRTFGERQMSHEVVIRSAVPVLLAIGGPDRIASADLDDRFAPRLDEAASFGDVKGLATFVGVPRGPGARREVDGG